MITNKTSKLAQGIKLMSKIIDKIELGGTGYNKSKAWSTFHHIRRHYNVPKELEADIVNGNLRIR